MTAPRVHERRDGLVLANGTALADNFTNPRVISKLPKLQLRIEGEGIDKVADFVQIKVAGRPTYARVATGSLYDSASGVCLGSSRLRVSQP